MIEIIKNTLINYWQPIIAVIIFIVSFILQLIKKKPVNIVDTLKQQITTWLPGCIDFTEEHCGCLKGEDKLQYCIDFIYTFFVKDYLSREEFDKQYVNFIKVQIEAILSTPQKKGGSR